ncbi:MAG: hypothetical protein KC588_09300 [Nitrospira sp.]|nr:hypothetical protein [Nitrospira sp.]
MIAKLAYEISKNGGEKHGRDYADWVDIEPQLLPIFFKILTCRGCPTQRSNTATGAGPEVSFHYIHSIQPNKGKPPDNHALLLITNFSPS